MPIFEYKCKACNSVFERLVVNSSASNGHCPKCNSLETEKLLSRFSGIVSNSSYASASCPAKSICEPAGHNCGGCCPMHRH